MRTSDVFRMAVHNLWQRRVRTLFNLTGIVTGCIVLLMTAAGTSGARDAIHALFDSSDFARQIFIFPGGGSWEEPPEGEIIVDADMSEPRRERIRTALKRKWNQDRNDAKNRRYEITLEELESIRRISHVVAVIPMATTRCVIRTDSESLPSGMTACNIHSGTLQDSLLIGALAGAEDRQGVLIDEFLAWQMGFRNDSDLPKLVGQSLSIEYRATKSRVANIYNMLTAKPNLLSINEIQKQTQFLQTLLQLIGDLDKTSLSEEQKQQLRDLIGSGLQTGDEAPEQVITRQFIVRGIVCSGAEDAGTSLFRMWFHIPEPGIQIHPDLATEIYLSNDESNTFYQRHRHD